jgi:methyltransferase (TIGR00027 family)
MLPFLSSQTANIVTFFRAAANMSPNNQLFSDPIAAQFLPAYLKIPLLMPGFPRYAAWAFRRRQFGGGILLRARYAEDCLRKCVEEGTQQYIILGAGWDSFALRRPVELKHVSVFELDFPTTQNQKLKRLQKHGFKLDDNVHLVPINFERTTIEDALRDTQFDPKLPTFVTWQGVTYYLTIEAIEQVFTSLSSLCEDRLDIVIDYVEKKFVDEWWRYSESRRIHLAVALIGERFRTGFDPHTLNDWLLARGYQLKEDYRRGTIGEKYSENEISNYKLSKRTHLAHIRKI